ncbi:MAG: hypothetical protein AAF655_27685 [Bacteroidota bacterium]
MKIWETIHALSKLERQKFIHWLNMELAERNSDLPLILSVLLAEKAIPSRETIWKKSFPNTPFGDKQDNKLRLSLSKLMNQVRLFLAYRMLKDEDGLTVAMFLKKLNQLGLPHIFEEEAKKILNDQERKKLPSPSYYELRYQVHKQIRHHNLKYKGGNKSTPEHAARLNQHFDPWWIHEKYLLACVDDTLEQVHGQAVYTPLMSEVEEIIKAHPDYPKMDYLRLMKLTMDMGYDSPLENIFPLFQEVADNRNKYDEEEFSHLFIYLTNRSVRLFHSYESEETASLLFRLYRWGIENDVFLYKGSIIPGYMRAVVHTGILANQSREVVKLIPEYAKSIVPEAKEEILALCEAKISMHQKIFSKVLEKLEEKKFSDKLTEAESRFIQLQAEYELDKENAVELESPLSTLERFVRDQSGISPMYKRRYLQLISIFFRMIKQENRDRLEKLLTEIGSHSPYSIKGWLREKILEKMDGLAVYH